MNINSKYTQQDFLKETAYSRQNCQAGIIHIGVGAFHRAHQAAYINELLAYQDQQNWGIIGVNLRPQESDFMNQLADQEHCYILKTMSPDGQTRYQEIGSILDGYDWALNPQKAASIAAQDNIHMITMTVTEGGYYLFDDNRLDLSAEPVKLGLNGIGDCVYTYLRAALTERKKHNGSPITLLSCDNLLHNGNKLKTGFEQFLQACDDNELLSWVNENVSFPCCMVDRITPRMDKKHAFDVAEKFGIDDKLTVMGESFIQWVIEDNFAGPRPELERVGVTMVDNVNPYEDAKIRILNSGHTIVVYLAALKSYNTFDEGMTDPELEALFLGYQTQEAIPVIGDSPVDLLNYKDIIKERFSNKNISDSVARICADGVSKFPIFILDTLEGCYKKDINPEFILKGIASWYVFMRHVQKGLIPFSYTEPKWGFIEPFLAQGQEQAFAQNSTLWGELPIKKPEFITQLIEAIEEMQGRFPS